jgi:hypothetical protein
MAFPLKKINKNINLENLDDSNIIIIEVFFLRSTLTDSISRNMTLHIMGIYIEAGWGGDRGMDQLVFYQLFSNIYIYYI